MREAVIFDLDGTLTQSEEGIWNCVAYAAKRMQFPVPDAATLRKFVGPPLAWSFQHYMGMTEEQAIQATDVYRERYTTVGLFENRVYPGIRRLLRTLKRKGCYLAIATGKPQSPTERILDHFGLARWFDAVVGSTDNHADKEELIRKALPKKFDRAIMVGDTRFDMEGAKKAGITALGVGYGYGSEEELRNAGCDLYAATVQDVIDLLCPGETPPAGMFLSIEGLDGCGKTTQANKLVDELDRYGYEVVRSREPGGCPVAEEIRKVILDTKNTAMTDVTEAMLYAASRAQHVREVIRPAIAAGKVLLCDRFLDSSVAYQGGGRGLGVQAILDINAAAVDGTMPLATVYLDIDHNTSLNRRLAVSKPDRIEQESAAFFARIEDAYRELIRRDPGRFIVVDATRSVEEISCDILDDVLARLMEAEDLQ